MITVAARAVNQDMLDEYTARNNSALKELVEHHHVDVRPFPDDVLATLKKISWEVYDEMSAKDETFARVWASYREFMEGAKEYHKISEQYYYEKR